LSGKSKDKGTTNQSIGRPGPWREGRYQRSGQSLDESVEPEQPLDTKRPIDAPSAPKIPHSPRSTAVHLDEYTATGAKPDAGDTKPK
jgi:hypothetical protein